ncbi:hypothetical protein F5Y14DRAFT_461148 [Nemania sp. NC0429]|nr:hypothetical protein F5Y14DRAFT_461148 [Nemania sp. NC0429]
MTSNQTLIVPVGTRLSYGIELEMLIPYLSPDAPDPDEAISSMLAPVLRIDSDRAYIKANKDRLLSGSGLGGEDSEVNYTDATYMAIEDHLRTTLRRHGVRIKGRKEPVDMTVPAHLRGLDQWDIVQDGSVTEAYELEKGTTEKYQWFSAEFRSPACWDVQQAYEEMGFVVNLLKLKYRIRVNFTCGFHVHVGNGPRYFRPETIKRAGAFLWAADPILSRLHAPWRRVSDYATSIRYRGRVACWEEMTPADIEWVLDSFTGGDPNDDVVDLMQVLPWSDRTREWHDFQGRENWENYARTRARNGPYMLFSEIPGTLPQVSQEQHLPTPEDTRAEMSEDLGGGAHDRRLLALMETAGFRACCLRNFGCSEPRRLTQDQLNKLLILDQSEKLYRDKPLDDLTASEFHNVLVACTPYLESVRGVWLWDPSKNDMRHVVTNFNLTLKHPRPRGFVKAQHRPDLERLSELAVPLAQAEMELGFRDEEDEEDLFSSSRNADARNTVEPYLYDRTEQLMQQEGFPLERVEEILALWERPPSRRPGDRNRSPPRAVPMAALEESDAGNQNSPEAVSTVAPGSHVGNQNSPEEAASPSNSGAGSHSSSINYSSGESSAYVPAASKALWQAFPNTDDISQAESHGKSKSNLPASAPLASNPSLITVKPVSNPSLITVQPASIHSKAPGSTKSSGSSPFVSNPNSSISSPFVSNPSSGHLRPPSRSRTPARSLRSSASSPFINDPDSSGSSAFVTNPDSSGSSAFVSNPSSDGRQKGGTSKAPARSLRSSASSPFVSNPNSSGSSAFVTNPDSSGSSAFISNPSSDGPRQASTTKAPGKSKPKSNSPSSSSSSSASSSFVSNPSAGQQGQASGAAADQPGSPGKPSSSSPASVFISNPSPISHQAQDAAEEGPKKLQPHNTSLLPQSYFDRVAPAMDLPPGRYGRQDRISWLPRPGGSDSNRDPGEPHPRGDEEECREGCLEHVMTDTWTGAAAIAGAESATAAAIMLVDEAARRLNYNFMAYELGARPWEDGMKRTVEFRESVGSLEPAWILLWIRICVGIMRFTQDAPVETFLAVLQRVVSEEERLRALEDGRSEGWEEDPQAGLYDVCDLLEDMGLFAEAGAIRRREIEFGPPR